jgi:pimeloyl-ACP methyl ester carboxylesterase
MGSMRIDIELEASGLQLRGWFYRSAVLQERAPVVVMAHGFSAVKEMFLDAFAEVFAAAGLAVLVYDRRKLGASDGLPRQEVEPWADVLDYRDAVSYVRTLPGVDPERVAIWGTSYGGALALAAAALDRRIRAVVAQVPVLAQRPRDPATQAALQQLFDADRDARYRGAAPALMPVCTPEPRRPAVLPTPDVWAFKLETEARAPSWRNEVTLRSVENLLAWDPAALLPRIGPTPALVIVADEDLVIPKKVLLAECKRITGPCEVLSIPGGHFDAYNPARPQFAMASSAARDFLARALGVSPDRTRAL